MELTKSLGLRHRSRERCRRDQRFRMDTFLYKAALIHSHANAMRSIFSWSSWLKIDSLELLARLVWLTSPYQAARQAWLGSARLRSGLGRIRVASSFFSHCRFSILEPFVRLLYLFSESDLLYCILSESKKTIEKSDPPIFVQWVGSPQLVVKKALPSHGSLAFSLSALVGKRASAWRWPRAPRAPRSSFPLLKRNQNRYNG